MNQDEAVATMIKYRMEQANKAIEDALCLEAGNGSPRSIINRTYYAMFYAALALLLRESGCCGREFCQSHRTISVRYKNNVNRHHDWNYFCFCAPSFYNTRHHSGYGSVG